MAASTLTKAIPGIHKTPHSGITVTTDTTTRGVDVRHDQERPIERNPRAQPRQVWLLWNFISSRIPLKWIAHWGLRVGDENPSSGYIWELGQYGGAAKVGSRGEAGEFSGGEVRAGYHDGQTQWAGEASVGITTTLTDTELWDYVGQTILDMKLPLKGVGLALEEETYQVFKKNCQDFTRLLAINITKRPSRAGQPISQAEKDDRKKVEDFFKKQWSSAKFAPNFTPQRRSNARPVLGAPGTPMQWREVAVSGSAS